MQQGLEFAQQGGHATGVMEILHVVLARGLQVKQHRGFPPHAVECLQVHLKTHAPGNRGQVNDAVA